MTWVVGANIEFGSVLLASDIRITLADKREIDCCQKIYPLGRHLVGGFAGSVTIGFDIVALLQAEFGKAAPDRAWDLRAVVDLWLPRVIRDRFGRHKSEHRKLGASFLVGSVSSARNFKTIFPETALYAFRSANKFKADPVSVGGAASIGNGRSLEDPILEIVRSKEFMLTSNAGPQMHSFILATHLRERVLARPIAGVSPCFMMGWVVRGNQGIEPWTTLAADEKTPTGTKISLARSLEDLEKMIGGGAANAVG